MGLINQDFNFEEFKNWFIAKKNFAAHPSWKATDIDEEDEGEPEGRWLYRGTYTCTVTSEGEGEFEPHTFDFMMLYEDKDMGKLVTRVYNDENLGAEEMKPQVPGGKPEYAYKGLHTIAGSIDHTKKEIE